MWHRPLRSKPCVHTWSQDLAKADGITKRQTFRRERSNSPKSRGQPQVTFLYAMRPGNDVSTTAFCSRARVLSRLGQALAAHGRSSRGFVEAAGAAWAGGFP